MPSLLARRPLIVPLTDEVLREDSVRRWLLPLVLGSRAKTLHLDLSDVELPTTDGLVRLGRLHQQLQAAGVALVLLNVRPDLYDAFVTTGLTQQFEVQAA